jgi:hypothetical protein
MTVGNVTYTFVTVLDNSIANQILIGATLAATSQNIIDAGNANQTTGGIGYSWPTVENDLVNFDTFQPLQIWAKYCGDAGNRIGCSSTAAGLFFIGVDGGFTSHLTGGTDPPAGTGDISLSCISSTDYSKVTQPSLLYQPGDANVTVILPQLMGPPYELRPNPDPLPAFWWLEVQYTRVGSKTITVENTALVDARAAIEYSSGIYQRSITANSVADIATAYQAAQKLLAQYAVIPMTLKFDSYQSPSHYHINDYLFFAITNPTSALNGRQFVIQEVQGEYIPGLDELPAYTVKHSITAISGSTITNTVTDLDFWTSLARRSVTPAPQVAPPLEIQSPLPLSISVFDATIANDVADHHPLQQTYEVRMISVTPRIVPITDLWGELKLAAQHNPVSGGLMHPGISLTRFLIPAGTAADARVIVPPDHSRDPKAVNPGDPTSTDGAGNLFILGGPTWTITPPMVLPVGRIVTVDVTAGDGAKSATGVFTVRFDVVPRAE